MGLNPIPSGQVMVREAAVELVIFDCDGVLIDSELIACAADAEALSDFGYQITTETVVERFSGVPAEAVYAMIEAEMSRALPPDFKGQIEERILAKYCSELKPIPGITEVLSELPSKRCVASSSTPAKLALGLVETGLYEALNPHIFSTVLVERGKPHPDIFLYAAREMGVAAANCVVVEDSVAGVTAARAAGMRTIGFVGGSHCGANQLDKLLEAGAETVIDDMHRLLPTLAGVGDHHY